MATVEVWTVGGGEYIVNVFNAVAAWTGEGGYKSMIQVVMVMGFAMACLTIAFDSNWRAWINWFLQATLMYLCLMVPRVDVQVTDRINPSLAPSFVANVPIGLGLMASFTSQIGDYLTTSSEVVFGLPNDLNYSTNGMVYGARLYQATQAIQFNDAEFATNLDEHMHNCVFYDVLLGRKSIAMLAKSADLWADIGPGSPARAQKYLTRNNDGTVSSAIVTCQTAYRNMSAQLAGTGGPIDQVSEPLSRSLYPKLLPAVAKAKLLADLGGAYTYLSGVSATASDILKQNLMINAMTQAMHTLPAAAGGSSVDVYAQTRAEIQTRNTYSSISLAAMKWVPLLHIVLTVMFYALFPVLFPLFLLPGTGVSTLKGYVTGFFYLAAWGPLFVILHMILMFKGSGDLTAVANGTGATLFSYAGISGVTDDVSLLAGYLIASVPFIAGGVAKGAMAISSNATSFLAPSQNAAEVAANEASTGNIALGNTSLDNYSANNRQANNWSSLATYASGSSAFTTRGEDGYVTHSYPGSEVGDSSGAISRLAVTPTLSQDLQSSFTTAASSATARTESLVNSASTSRSVANTQASELRSALQHTVSNNNELGEDTRQSINTGLNAQQQLSQRLQDSAHLTKSEADGASTELFLSGQVNGGYGIPGSGVTGLSGGVSVAAGGKRSSTHSTGTSATADVGKANEILASVAKSANFNDQRDSFNRAVRSTGDSAITAKADTTTASYTQAASTTQEARKSYETSQRLEQAASLRRSNSVSVSENDSQEFAQFANREIAIQRAGGHTPAWRGPTTELAVTPQQLGEQSDLVQKFVAYKEQQIAAGVEPSLIAPSAGGIVRPSANAQSKIHPPVGVVGSGGLPAATGPDGGPLDAGRAAFARDFQSSGQRGSGILEGGLKGLRRETSGVSNDPSLTLRSTGSKGWAATLDDYLP